MLRHLTRLSALLLAPLLCLPIAASAADLVVYSARNEQLIRPLFEAYTAKTGVSIDFVTDKEGPLLARLKAEGANTPADLLITVDAGNLWHAANEGVLAPIDSEILAANIPAKLRDPENRWFGLSVRARTIAYNTERVKPEELSTYEALGDPTWKGRLILRTSKKVYNQSLVAALIKEHGVEKAEEIVKSWVANLADQPTSNDTQALEAVAAGQGDVTVVNTYYFGKLLRDKPELPLALFWPGQENGSGVHMNVSGAGVTAHAPHRAAAVAFLEWLSTAEAQGLFAELNLEYPANPSVEPAPEVAAWGSFVGSPLNVAEYGALQAEAIKLMDRVDYK